MDDDDALSRGLADLAARMERHGRTLADIALMAWSEPSATSSTEAYLDRLGQLGAMGITWTPLRIDTSSFPAALDDLRAWGQVRRQVR
jgi:hypothetical protein